MKRNVIRIRNLRSAEGERIAVVIPVSHTRGKGELLSLGRDTDMTLPDTFSVKELDGEGAVLLPAFCDLCGFPAKGKTPEGVLAETAAAARSGFSDIVSLSAAKPSGTPYCRVISPENLRNPRENTVCSVYSDYDRPEANSARLYEQMREAAKTDSLLLMNPLHPSFEGELYAGKVADYFGVCGMAHFSERLRVRELLLLAGETGCRLCLPSVSTGEAIAEIRDAKRRGVRVYCGVSSFHFAFCEDEMMLCGTNAKISPPLGTRNDRDAILNAISDGTVDFLSTLHTPCPRSEKMKKMKDAAPGGIGYQTAFAAAMTYLVLPGVIPFAGLKCLMSDTPRKLLGLEESPDFVLVSPEEEWIAGEGTLYGREKQTPFLGQPLRGRVKHTYILGEWK